MEIKGNIGEEVYIKGKINSIKIDSQGIIYHVSLNSIEQAVHEEDVMFDEKTKKTSTVACSKKRGRPKKATLDSLVKKAEKVGGGDKKI